MIITMFSTPKMQLVIFLSLIVVSAVYHEKNFVSVIIILTSILAFVAFDLLFIFIRKLPLFFVSAAIASGLIVSLLASPHLSWYEIVLASLLASFGKNFIRIQRRHIFNPAAFGLFFTALMFHQSVSWWGQAAAFFILLIAPAYVSVIRLQRYWIIISFFIMYILINAFFQFSHGGFDIRIVLLNTLFNPVTIFFGLVMLPEPMTSPNNHLRQMLYGAFVAAIASVTVFIPRIPDPLITGLLLGNFAFFWFR